MFNVARREIYAMEFLPQNLAKFQIGFKYENSMSSIEIINYEDILDDKMLYQEISSYLEKVALALNTKRF